MEVLRIRGFHIFVDEGNSFSVWRSGFCLHRGMTLAEAIAFCREAKEKEDML